MKKIVELLAAFLGSFEVTLKALCGFESGLELHAFAFLQSYRLR